MAAAVFELYHVEVEDLFSSCSLSLWLQKRTVAAPKRTMMMMMKLTSILLLLPLAVVAQTCVGNADCLNGGECIVSDTGGDESHSNAGEDSYCRCAPKYVGSDCTTYCPIDCNNGASCEYKPVMHISDTMNSDYVCNCRSGWKGSQCDIKVEECPDGHECLNGATCRISDDNDDTLEETYACDCPSTHQGDYCQHLAGMKTSTTAAATAPAPAKEGLTPGAVAGIVFGMFAAVALVVGVLFAAKTTRKAPRDASTTVGQLDADGSTTMNGVKTNDTTTDSIASPIEAEDMEKDDVSEII
jgi:hypothetical protein